MSSSAREKVLADVEESRTRTDALPLVVVRAGKTGAGRWRRSARLVKDEQGQSGRRQHGRKRHSRGHASHEPLDLLRHLLVSLLAILKNLARLDIRLVVLLVLLLQFLVDGGRLRLASSLARGQHACGQRARAKRATYNPALENDLAESLIIGEKSRSQSLLRVGRDEFILLQLDGLSRFGIRRGI